MKYILYSIVDFTNHKYCPGWQVWYSETGCQNIHTKSFDSKEQADIWTNNNCQMEAAE